MSKKTHAPSDHPILYTIVPINPNAHLFQITCVVNQPEQHGQVFTLPAWIPGSYMIRDFSRHIVTIHASCEGEDVTISKLDKDTWRCEACRGPLEVEYQVYAKDLSVRGAHLDHDHAYFNGSCVFLQVQNQQQQPCQLEIMPPQGEAFSHWRLATAMQTVDAEPHGFGRYQAQDYDELIDHPVEMGEFTLASFTAGGIPHEIVISGQHRADMKRLSDDLKKICQTHIALFTELPKIKRYVFLIMAVGEGYGGLEHRASTSLLCSRDDLPLTTNSETSDNYRTLLGLCSHEYFHTWNIKRIKPAVFQPYQLSSESYTRQLWAFEGITSYYDDLGLVRSGVISKESYLELLGQLITRVQRGQGRFKQSVADSSFEAWTKFYKQDESAPNNIVSYYTKGSLLALALDLTLRIQTQQKISLDDLMRHLWQQYGKPLIGVPESAIESLAEEISGIKLKEFFQSYLYGTEDPPLLSLLEQVGIEVHFRTASNVDDKGGTPDDNSTQVGQAVQLGARVLQHELGARLCHVFDGGSAQNAGLAAGDIIIAVDGLKTNKVNLEKNIASYPLDSELTLHYFRRDELRQCTLRLQPAALDTCYLLTKSDLPDAIKHNQQCWLEADTR